MNNRALFTTLAIAALVASACRDGTKEQSPGEVLARDSSLASELKQSDTSAFAEAADVAMAFDPDSALPPVNAPRPAVSARAAAVPAAESPAAATPAPAASPSPVPMRIDRSSDVRSRPTASASPSASPSATPSASTRAPMRPAPATIHPDPLPTRGLPATPARVAATTNRVDPNASAILANVPGAALPPARSDEPCASPATASQRRCLMLHLARSDVILDRTYQSLIADMKREAGTPRGGTEPEAVHQLRVAQRAWLVFRDTECRRRNRGKEGPLWAPVRAQCLGEFSGNREAELARALRERQGR